MLCTRNNVFVVDEEPQGRGIVSFCKPGWGIDRQMKQNCKSLGVCPGGGGMVTGRIDHALPILNVFKFSTKNIREKAYLQNALNRPRMLNL